MAERIGTVYIGGARHYVHPETGEKAPGVTSILSQLPKPFLAPWAAKLAAEWAIDNLASVTDIASRDREAAVDMVKGASKRYTAQAAKYGVEVHDYLEAKLLGHPLPALSARGQEFIPAIDTWFDAWQPEPVLTEASVWGVCDAGPYAGSFDAIVKIAGEQVLIDFKTGKSAHSDAAIQLSCYAAATEIIGGGEIPRIDAAAVVHVRPTAEGGVKLYPAAIGPDKVAVFSALYQVWRWSQVEKNALGRPMILPPK